MANKRGYLFFVTLGVIAILIAQLLSRFGYPLIGWFIGGALIALLAALFFGSPEKKRAGRILPAMLLTGLATAAVAFVARALGL